MPTRTPSNSSPATVPGLGPALLWAALAAAAVPAHADPGRPARTEAAASAPDGSASAAAGDAVLQLLLERGLLARPAELKAQAQARVQAGLDASAVGTQIRDVMSDLVLSAMNFLGVPYRRGGNDAEQGFDCSGFTRYVFENSLGLVLPRRADQQANEAGLLKIRRDELRPGDLVFFNTMRRAFSHVGIYIGEGRFIHAPRAGGQVRIEDMRTAYWHKRFDGARRAERPGETAAEPPAEPQLRGGAAREPRRP